jgi:type II secretory pathway pseudopilin PulG
MDETINQKQKHLTRKKGFALLITLSVLSVIIALTLILLSYFDQVRRDAANTRALIQANIFYANVLKAFKVHKPKRVLKKIYKRPSILQKGKFRLTIECKPLSSGVNINWLSPYAARKNDKNYVHKRRVALELYQMLVSKYKVKDPQELFERILEAIGGKKKYVQTQYSRLRQKNGIISYEQFEDIVTRYQLEVDDTKIGKVPWKKYFSFSREGTRIDVEYSSAELIHHLFDIDMGSIREWQMGREALEDTRSLKQFVSDEFQLAPYNKYKQQAVISGKILAEAICKVGYNVAGQAYHFTFEYINGGGRHFEFFRQH